MGELTRRSLCAVILIGLVLIGLVCSPLKPAVPSQAADKQDKIVGGLAKEALEKMRQRLGDKYKYKTIGYIAHAALANEKGFERANLFLESFTKKIKEIIFSEQPKYVIRVYTYQTVRKLRRYTRAPMGAAGFYKPLAKSLYMNLETGLGTPAHELTHALHYADWGKRKMCRLWFTESLGLLMENCLRTSKGEFIGISLSNFRLKTLQSAISSGRCPTWKGFMKRRFRNRPNEYAISRWIATYLFHQGLLKKYYDEYKASVEEDPYGIKSMEKVFDKPLEDIEKEWREWVLGIESEVNKVMGETFPILGIISKQDKKPGVLVGGVSPLSPADKCGIKKGDRILQIGGKTLKDFKELLGFLRRRKEAEKVTIKLEREGTTREVSVTLEQFEDG